MSSIALRKLRRNCRDYGLGVTSRKVLGALMQGVYEASDYKIYRIELDRYRPAEDEAIPFDYRLLGTDEGDLIDQVEQLEDWLDGSVRRRLSDGALCLAGLDGDRLAGFNLVSFNDVEIPLIHYRWRLKPHCAWSEQITVHNNYRGRGVAQTLRHRMFGLLKQRGIRRFYGGALCVNQPSLHLARKVGFQEILEVHYRRYFNQSHWDFVRLRPCN